MFDAFIKINFKAKAIVCIFFQCQSCFFFAYFLNASAIFPWTPVQRICKRIRKCTVFGFARHVSHLFKLVGFKKKKTYCLRFCGSSENLQDRNEMPHSFLIARANKLNWYRNHTAPQRCQPDRSGTLDFLLDSCYCDLDMTISVAR